MKAAVISCRYYNVQGEKWEACFFRKGDVFPDTEEVTVPKQGVWARNMSLGWEHSCFFGESWRHVSMEAAVLYLPDRQRP